MSVLEEKGFFVGVDVGGSRVKAVVGDLEGNVLKRRWILSGVSSGLDCEEVFLRIVGLVRRLLDDVGCLDSHLLGVGVGVPGVVSKLGVVERLPNFSVLDGFDLRGRLRVEFGCLVKVVNDAQLPFFYFSSLSLNSSLQLGSCLFLTLGTGLGVSFCLNGRLFVNRFGSCEFAHARIFESREVEELLSVRFLLGRRSRSLKEVSEFRFRRYGRNLGIVIADLHDLFGFDRVFLCGGVSNYSHIFLDACLRSFEKSSFFPVCELEVAPKGLEVGCVGAMRMVLRKK